MTALFISEILFFFIERMNCEKWLKVICVIVIAFFGVAAGFLQIILPYAIAQGMVGLGFMYLGYLARMYNVIDRICELRWTKLAICSVISIVLIYVNGYIDMRTQQYSFIPLFWINACLAITIGLYFSRKLEGKIKHILLYKYLIDIGRNSIVYVVLNQIVIVSIKFLLNGITTDNIIRKGIKYAGIYVAVFIVLHGLSMVITRTKLKVLIGR